MKKGLSSDLPSFFGFHPWQLYYLESAPKKTTTKSGCMSSEEGEKRVLLERPATTISTSPFYGCQYLVEEKGRPIVLRRYGIYFMNKKSALLGPGTSKEDSLAPLCV